MTQKKRKKVAKKTPPDPKPKPRRRKPAFDLDRFVEDAKVASVGCSVCRDWPAMTKDIRATMDRYIKLGRPLPWKLLWESMREHHGFSGSYELFRKHCKNCEVDRWRQTPGST